jgi:DNA (cytosine-5)-methyltransferase 1
MAHVDLCSGIGGFALGFQWAGLSKPVLFCDIEPWSRKVLRKHWPDVPIAKDVKELADDPNGLVPECAILTAGYPCQPFSLALAGKRRGTEDDRHIWPYIFSIIQPKRPAWCVFENVYGHVSMGLDEVLSDLEGEEYATRPFIVPACAADAPHRRDRVWIIARNVGDTRCKFRKEGGNSEEGQASIRGKSSSVNKRSGKDVADTASTRLQGFGAGRQQELHSHAKEAIFMRGSERPKSAAWLPEPAVGRVAHGIPRRVDRLKGLGNTIVPQIAQRIGETIKHCEST